MQVRERHSSHRVVPACMGLLGRCYGLQDVKIGLMGIAQLEVCVLAPVYESVVVGIGLVGKNRIRQERQGLVGASVGSASKCPTSLHSTLQLTRHLLHNAKAQEVSTDDRNRPLR